MKATSIVFAGAALGAGLYAAWLWYCSTTIKIDPALHKMDDGRDAFRMMEWIENVMKSTTEISHLNANAAIWTAITVVLGALSTVCGALGSN
jgi:HAMP domain-containing protein